jgi:hypothetical protein
MKTFQVQSWHFVSLYESLALPSTIQLLRYPVQKTRPPYGRRNNPGTPTLTLRVGAKAPEISY